MRQIGLAFVVAHALAAAPLYAAELLPARLSIYLDPVFAGDGSVRTWSDIQIIDVPIRESGFSDRFDGVLGYSEENEAGELGYDIAFSGDIFPFVEGTMAFLDNGAPTSFAVSLTLAIPDILGAANFTFEGTVNNLARGAAVTLPAGQPGFFSYAVNGSLVGSQGTGPVSPLTSQSFTDAGSLDCAVLPGGACTMISSFFVATGPGGGEIVTSYMKFDVDAATPVPLPASLPLAMLATGSLVALRRRRAA